MCRCVKCETARGLVYGLAVFEVPTRASVDTQD